MWIKTRRHFFTRIFHKANSIGRTGLRKRRKPWLLPLLVLMAVVVGSSFWTVQLWYSTMQIMDAIVTTTEPVENNKEPRSRSTTTHPSPLPQVTFQSPQDFANKNYPRRFTFPPSNKNYTIGMLDPILQKGKGWDTSPIVLKNFHLIFFTTPKVGTTVFKKLFRRMMGYELWPLEDINIPHNPQWNGLEYLYDYPLDQVHDMLTSPNWTRAIFVRDPLERLLSAYLDKAVRQNGTYVKRHCCGIKSDKSLSKLRVEIQQHEDQIRQHIFQQQQEPQPLQEPHPQQRPMNRGKSLLLASSMSQPKGKLEPQQQPQRRRLQAIDMRVLNRLRSDAALQAMITNNYNNTPRPQSVAEGVPLAAVCSNLTMQTPITWSTFVQDMLNSCSIDPHWKTQVVPSLRWINFVGHFESLHADTRRLLEQIGAWHRYGASGWPGGGPIFQENTAQHKTSSRELMASYYNDSTIRQRVWQFYRQDYENKILNLTMPKFTSEMPSAE